MQAQRRQGNFSQRALPSCSLHSHPHPLPFVHSLLTQHATTFPSLYYRHNTFAVSDLETRFFTPKRFPLDSSTSPYQTPAQHVLRRRRIRRRSRWRPRLLERVRKQQHWIWVLQHLDKPIRIVRVGRYTPPSHGRGITVVVVGLPSICYLSSYQTLRAVRVRRPRLLCLLFGQVKQQVVAYLLRQRRVPPPLTHASHRSSLTHYL